MTNVLSFVHLSDIHFGQERGGEVHFHNDVRDQLVQDVKNFYHKRTLSGSGATGILVTGDIAYAGKREDYDKASEFLDLVAKAAGCENTAVRVAPGNHDIDLDEITHGMRTNLGAIEQKGEKELERQFEDPRDRARLYDRLREYAVFAEGYGCPLDGDGGHAGEKDYPLAPGRTLRFVSWNSALVCSGKDQKGKLLLGTKQRVLPSEVGIERVVLCHHPLPWFADAADARKYLKNRARVFLSGHEHLADIAVEEVEDDTHFLHLAAGATTPPDGYEYTYNVLDFSWQSSTDRLVVTVHPRIWVDGRKRFDADVNRLGAENKSCSLGCPQFRAASKIVEVPGLAPIAPSDSAPKDGAPKEDPPSTTAVPQPVAVLSNDDDFPRLRLRFFRELSRVQRLKVLVALGGLPADLDGFPTMALERKALDFVRSKGKLEDLEAAINNERPTEANRSPAREGRHDT